MESRKFPILTLAPAILVGCAICLFELGPLIWATAAFRSSEISPDVTQAFNDFGWFAFLYTWPPFSMWFIVIAIAIWRDRGVPRLFSRKAAWVNICTAITFIPAGFIGFAKSGPFAFNGALAFWFPLACFFV